MKSLFGGIYNSKKILVTGHNGFKGSWLAYWLNRMGAEVHGYSLHPPSKPNHYSIIDLKIDPEASDLLDLEKLNQRISDIKPEIIFHLAAQPLVRTAYEDPLNTVMTNVVGSVHLFEAVRGQDSVKAVINVTTDKCYENREWVWGYRENEPMGGYDPYSASKGASEILTSCWRRSFFNPDDYGVSHNTLLASARAGNVIGGGDWGKDRLIPDIVRAAAEKKAVQIRNPASTRPWQHVLEPLSGYLLLGQHLLEGRKEFAEGWNFGPLTSENYSVKEILEIAVGVWPEIRFDLDPNQNQPHEAGMLSLDCTKASRYLNWSPVWNGRTAVEKTLEWYQNYYENNQALTDKQLSEYVAAAAELRHNWAN